MTAIRDLDAELPKVPKPRAAPANPPRRKRRPTAERLLLEEASEHLKNRAALLRAETSSFNTSSLYSFTAARIDALADNSTSNAIAAVTQMQAQTSLLVWELGQILDSLNRPVTTTKKEKK